MENNKTLKILCKDGLFYCIIFISLFIERDDQDQFDWMQVQLTQNGFYIENEQSLDAGKDAFLPLKLN